MTHEIAIRQMRADEITRIAELDRSEHVTLHYRITGGVLQAEAVDWHVPRWALDGTGPHSAAGKIAAWRPLMASGSVLLGALDAERLVGIAILRFRLTESMAQLAALHVSRAYRRQGIARRLVVEVIRRARADGARALYVSATPSGSAVAFYQAQGFALVPEPHPELFVLEPEDIHMVMGL